MPPNPPVALGVLAWAEVRARAVPATLQGDETITVPQAVVRQCTAPPRAESDSLGVGPWHQSWNTLSEDSWRRGGWWAGAEFPPTCHLGPGFSLSSLSRVWALPLSGSRLPPSPSPHYLARWTPPRTSRAPPSLMPHTDARPQIGNCSCRSLQQHLRPQAPIQWPSNRAPMVPLAPSSPVDSQGWKNADLITRPLLAFLGSQGVSQTQGRLSLQHRNGKQKGTELGVVDATQLGVQGQLGVGGPGLLRSRSRGSWSWHCHQNHHQTFVMLLSLHHAPQETALPCPSQLLHCYLSLVPHRGCLVHPALGSPPELPGPSVRDPMSVLVIADVCLEQKVP